jgi:hypothetical protein
MSAQDLVPRLGAVALLHLPKEVALGVGDVMVEVPKGKRCHVDAKGRIGRGEERRSRNQQVYRSERQAGVLGVLAAQGQNPAGVFLAVAGLSRQVKRSDWGAILPTYARCVRITRDQREIFPIHPSAFLDPAESALHAALVAAQSAPRRPGSVEDFMAVFEPMMPSINHFF